MSTEKEEKQEKAPNAVPIVEDVESAENLTFSPPVYVQRYQAIVDLLDEDKWRKSVKSVVDFGCSDFKLFKHLKSLDHIEHVNAVDVDESLMSRCQYEARPKVHEYLSRYSRNLTVDLFVGSIAEPDSRLVDVDAVIAIELIEHLYPETLERVPHTVFGCMRPKLAVFTTPNSDFNVLFKLKGFRHYDHKFEWSRREFQEWCHTVLRTYDEYDVSFRDIGAGPEGTDHLGSVSQMAVFTRRDCLENNSNYEQVTATPYKLFSRIVYPFEKDERSDDQKLLDEIKYSVNNVLIHKSLYHDYYTDDSCEIPIHFLRKQMSNKFSDEDALRKKLLEFQYEIALNGDGVEVVRVTEDDESSSSDDYEYDPNDCDLTLNFSGTVGSEETWD